MGFHPLNFTKSWENRDDFPTYEPDEAHVRADMQLLHDETRDALNAVVQLLNSPQAAANLPVAPGRLQSQTVQAALEEVLTATEQAAAGTIPNGSIAREKLTPGLLERVYGGRLVVSLDDPGPDRSPASDFPVGQLWLRPAHEIYNLAGRDWTVSGGSAVRQEDGWRLVSDGSAASVTASQNLENLGKPGDRVLVHLLASQVSAHFSQVCLYLNDLEQELTPGGAFETVLDSGGGLELLVSAQAPYEEQGLQVLLEKLVVVNLDTVCRAVPWAADKADWPAFIAAQAPFDVLQPHWAVFVQQAPGQWIQAAGPVLPVERGGTGLTACKAGDLLYADSQGRWKTLAAPKGKHLLAFDGSPRWQPEQALLQHLGVLHLATGSYAGTGRARTVELPVRPRLLLLQAEPGVGIGASYLEDWPEFLFPGQTRRQHCHGKTTESNYASGEAIMTLQGSTVTLSAEASDGRAMDNAAGNRPGVTYSWAALYEEAPHET